MASSSTLGESKPNSILIKMREKAAAEKNVESAMAAPAKPPGTAKHIGSTNPLSIRIENHLLQVQTSSRPTTTQSPSALKSILDPANKPTVLEPVKPSPKKQEEKPLSPMQTYEMSDREEDSDSESESDGDENQRPKKSVCYNVHFHLRSLVISSSDLMRLILSHSRFQNGLKRQTSFARWKDNMLMVSIASIRIKFLERFSHATWKKSLIRKRRGIRKELALAIGRRIT